MDRKIVEEMVKRINIKKNDNYTKYCKANGIEFLDKFYIGDEDTKYENNYINVGVDEILAEYDFPKRLKEIANKKVGVVSLGHLVCSVANEIIHDYECELNKPRFDYIKACRSITCILEKGFTQNYTYEANHQEKYTREYLMDLIGKVAIENMEEINKVFEEHNIKQLNAKAFILTKVYNDAIYYRDSARNYVDNYLKLLEV